MLFTYKKNYLDRGHLDVVESRRGDKAGGLSLQHLLVDRHKRHTFPVWVLNTGFLMAAEQGQFTAQQLDMVALSLK